MKFEIYKSYNILKFRTEWRWRLLARNGEPIASGESYINKSDCSDIVAKMQLQVSSAAVVELH